MNRLYLYTGGVGVAVLVSLILAWIIFSSSTSQQQSLNTSGGTFGSLDNTTSNTSNTTGAAATPSTQNGVVVSTQQKIFKISDGPVAGATFVVTTRPTTTVARYVMADNGHAYDVVLDSAGAVPKALSNTTVPGAVSTLWLEGGNAAVLQYFDNGTPKTMYLGLPAADSTSTSPVRIQFLPDNIVGLAGSPDGANIAYLLRTTSGVDGFVAKSDGTGSKKLFSLPLQQVQLRWPSKGTLLAYSNASAGAPGIAFAIDAKTGATTPLVYGPGLTADADASFAHVLYQTADTNRATYVHDVNQGADRPVSFNPFPEQCVQSPLGVVILLCATPLSYAPANYIDSWHQGTASLADSLIAFNLASATSTLLATPGGNDGGVATDMLSLAVSPDGRYILFVSKFDRSLWGVRLAQ